MTISIRTKNGSTHTHSFSEDAKAKFEAGVVGVIINDQIVAIYNRAEIVYLQIDYTQHKAT